jgi:menaquinone-dependent protoporphyrinogen oxidase
MSSRNILIVYGTSYGQTAKVARFMADRLTEMGDSVTLVDAGGLLRSTSLPRTPLDFDGVIVGSSVLYGRHQRSIERFVGAHRDALNAMPSAFFSVSGSAASEDEATRAEARRVVRTFLSATEWRPQLAETVAGAMAYTKYNPVVRWLLKRRSAKNGGPTDSSRDHEFTDWAQVRGFVEAFAATLPHPPEIRPLATA